MGVDREAWAGAVKESTQGALEQILSDLLRLRSADPYRDLNPLAWSGATMA